MVVCGSACVRYLWPVKFEICHVVQKVIVHQCVCAVFGFSGSLGCWGRGVGGREARKKGQGTHNHQLQRFGYS